MHAAPQPSSDPPPAPLALAALVAAGTLDPELGALLWILGGARVPAVVVAVEPGVAEPVRAALVGCLPADSRVIELDGEREDFSWMPESVELGWRRERPVPPARQNARPDAASTVMLAALEPGAGGTWGDRAHVAIRALAVGYSLLATTRGKRLEDVLGMLAARPVGAIDDELTRLGVVLTVEARPQGARVTAAHYLRPVVRDVNGHVQRRPPAVLATWDPAEDRFEDFSWGISDELAGRVGLRPVELERTQARLAVLLRTPAPRD